MGKSIKGNKRMYRSGVDMLDIERVITYLITGVSLFLLLFSLEFNLMQCVQINEYKGKEKVYRMQIEHYNPNDYTLKLKETNES